MPVPIHCEVASAIVLEDGPAVPRLLLLRRAKEYLKGEWCHVAGAIEAGESAWQAALREIEEETGLPVRRLYSADVTEQFYEASKNRISIVPAFVAYVDPDAPVRLNAEHSEYRWVSFDEARRLVPFGGQRRLYDEIEREFFQRHPTRWLEISLHQDGSA